MNCSMKKISKALFGYVSDWKNLLVHAIAGVILVLVIFVEPLPVYVRIIVFVLVVAFNCLEGEIEKQG
jgi:hypothetical protein